MRVAKHSYMSCFSPLVMMLTFFAEVLLLVWVALRGRKPTQLLIMAILACLAVFQLAEYMVCETAHADEWSMVGFVAITLLPALGFELMRVLVGAQANALRSAFYGVCAAFVFVFAVQDSSIVSAVCEGNYVIFRLRDQLHFAYGVYYFGGLAIAILYGLYHLRDLHAKRKRAVQWLLAGYASFTVPVAVLAALAPSTRDGIPSIMCGFALALAVIIGIPLGRMRLPRGK